MLHVSPWFDQSAFIQTCLLFLLQGKTHKLAAILSPQPILLLHFPSSLSIMLAPWFHGDSKRKRVSILFFPSRSQDSSLEDYFSPFFFFFSFFSSLFLRPIIHRRISSEQSPVLGRPLYPVFLLRSHSWTFGAGGQPFPFYPFSTLSLYLSKSISL